MENYICMNVGSKLPSQISYPVGRPVQWVEYGNSGLTLYIGYPQMSEMETNLFSGGNFTVALNELNNVDFFTFKFHDRNNPNIAIPPMEAPYHPNLEDTYDETLDFESDIKSLRQDPEMGIAFSIIAFDSLTGIVKGLSFVSLSNRFSTVMLESMANLYKTRMSREEFIRNVSVVQACCSTEEVFKTSKYQYRHTRR